MLVHFEDVFVRRLLNLHWQAAPRCCARTVLFFTQRPYIFVLWRWCHATSASFRSGRPAFPLRWCVTAHCPAPQPQKYRRCINSMGAALL